MLLQVAALEGQPRDPLLYAHATTMKRRSDEARRGGADAAQVLAEQKRVLGNEHPDMVRSAGNLFSFRISSASEALWPRTACEGGADGTKGETFGGVETSGWYEGKSAALVRRRVDQRRRRRRRRSSSSSKIHSKRKLRV